MKPFGFDRPDRTPERIAKAQAEAMDYLAQTNHAYEWNPHELETPH